MNIVMVNPHLGPVLGGIQKEMVCLAREFMALGDRIAFVTTYDEFPEGRVDLGQPLTYELPPELSVVRLDGRLRSRLRHFQPANPPLWLPGLSRAVLEFKPEGIIFFNIGWPLTILPALLELRRRSIVLYQTAYHAPLQRHPLDPWRSWLKLKVAGLSHQLIPHSHFEKKQIIRDGGIPESKITVVYPGVDIYNFSADEVGAFRAENNLIDKIVVSHVARLSAFKGTDKLIQALPVVRRRTSRDVVLLLVGRNVEEKYLCGLVAELGLETQVHFLGPVTERDLNLCYAVSDFFCLPSRYESFGFVFLEAMAHGLPVIGAGTGGVPEVIRDGETGFVLDPADDGEALTGALSRLAGDEALRASLGGQAQRWARERFSWPASAAAVKGIIGDLVA